MKIDTKKILAIIFYLFTGLIILYLFPLQQKFGYYYQKNKPWQYENLIAPFDFPVYKTEDEIISEKDSLKASFFPYVEKKDKVKDQVIDKINTIANNYFSNSNDDKHKQFLIDFYEFAYQLIDSIYNKGIISYHDRKKVGTDTVMVISGAYMQKTAVTSFLTVNKAASVCKNKIKEFVNSHKLENKLHFEDEFNCNKLLKPNIIYKEELSKKELENLLATVSYTNGMIQKGELIIATGELVNGKKYKILNSLKKEYETKVTARHLNRVLVGYGILILLALLINFLFIEFEFGKNSFIIHTLSMSVLLFFALLTFLVIKYRYINVYIIPFALIPIIFRAFYSEYIAIAVTIPAMFILSFLAPHSYEFLIYNLSAGIIVVFSMRTFTARSHFIKTAFFAFITYTSVYIAFKLIQGNPVTNIKITTIIIFGLSAIFLLLSYGLIYIIEKTFGLLSDISLIELSNTNKPLLKRLSEEAPGTFQHSIQVANLAYDVASKIKANALLVKTGALYHDIGKLYNPEYFTENQFGNFNPHENLSPEESAGIIISHVTKGMELARKNKIPHQIIDFISTHHGTSKVEYFLHKFKKLNPGITPDEKKFTYPGPKPFNKETAILMMCDAVEAASRSLPDYKAETIASLVDKIIDTQFKNGQFDNSTLTLQDISTAKSVLKIKLQNIYHTRVKYPE